MADCVLGWVRGTLSHTFVLALVPLLRLLPLSLSFPYSISVKLSLHIHPDVFISVSVCHQTDVSIEKNTRVSLVSVWYSGELLLILCSVVLVYTRDSSGWKCAPEFNNDCMANGLAKKRSNHHTTCLAWPRLDRSILFQSAIAKLAPLLYFLLLYIICATWIYLFCIRCPGCYCCCYETEKNWGLDRIADALYQLLFLSFFIYYLFFYSQHDHFILPIYLPYSFIWVIILFIRFLSAKCLLVNFNFACLTIHFFHILIKYKLDNPLDSLIFKNPSATKFTSPSLSFKLINNLSSWHK